MKRGGGKLLPKTGERSLHCFSVGFFFPLSVLSLSLSFSLSVSLPLSVALFLFLLFFPPGATQDTIALSFCSPNDFILFCSFC